MPYTVVTTSYLEILDPGDLRPRRSPRSDVALSRVGVPMPALNRFMYATVGGDWYWTDRLSWTYLQWLDYLDRPDLETWLLTVGGLPAGYFELEAQADRDMEIVYFGLIPQFIGAGLGGHLLTSAIERGWALGARRVWLHTCTLDHPHALAHYQARGMRLYKTETETKLLPPEPVGAWPGAR
jgi:GNAT superfamily N-acetyltransferase